MSGEGEETLLCSSPGLFGSGDTNVSIRHMLVGCGVVDVAVEAMKLNEPWIPASMSGRGVSQCRRWYLPGDF